MNLPSQIENRDVIPNWRSFDITVGLGEISAVGKVHNLDFNLENLRNDWRNNKNVGVAGELVGLHFISRANLTIEVLEAIEYINKHKDKCSDILIEISNSIISSELEYPNKEISSEKDVLVNQVRNLHDTYNHKLIKLFKEKTYEQKFNPINWVELARLYSIEGHNDKAERSILNAISLSSDNRFVLRSATRFFVHREDPEKALYFLRKSKMLDYDPWLTSAHIAVSSHVGKFSTFRKQGIRQIESKKFSKFDLSELNSSLGTIEYNEGGFKKSKPFFNESALSPNDNSLAQLEFMHSRDERFQSISLLNQKVKNDYEAQARKYSNVADWDNALIYCLKWMIDMPFSYSAAELGSYIAALVEDFDTGVLICEAGLVSNPYNLFLLNNTIYILLLKDDIEKVEMFLDIIENNRANLDNINLESKLTFRATIGLYFIKKGMIDEGIEYYESVIKESKILKKKYVECSALIYLTKELIRINHDKKEEYIERCKKLNIDNYKDLQYLRAKFIETKP